MSWRIGLFIAPLCAALLLLPAMRLGHAAAPQDFIDACQDDALRLCHDEAMSQDDLRITQCMRARKHLASKRCLVVARKYKKL